MRDEIEELTRNGIRIGRTYARFGLDVAAVWVDTAGKILGEVSEMLRDNAETIGPKVETDSESASPR